MSTLAPSVLIGSSSKNSYKILDGLEIQQDRTRVCGINCPWASGKIPIDLKWENLWAL